MKLFLLLLVTLASALQTPNTKSEVPVLDKVGESRALSLCDIPVVGAILCNSNGNGNLLGLPLIGTLCDYFPSLAGILCPGRPGSVSLEPGTPALGLGLLKDLCKLLPTLQPLLCPKTGESCADQDAPLLGLGLITDICNLIPLLKPLLCNGGPPPPKNSTRYLQQTLHADEPIKIHRPIKKHERKGHYYIKK